MLWPSLTTNAKPPPMPACLPACALQAAFKLFHAVKDVAMPADTDWLNTRFRIAAKKRWQFLEVACGYEAAGPGGRDTAARGGARAG